MAQSRLSANRVVAVGAYLAFISVLLGAFGAHALKERIDGRLLEVFQTGVHYQFLHSIGLILLGLWWTANRLELSKSMIWTVRGFLLGILLFSGSLYLLAFTGLPLFGAVTPLGGMLFMLGWLSWARAALKPSDPRA